MLHLDPFRGTEASIPSKDDPTKNDPEGMIESKGVYVNEHLNSHVVGNHVPLMCD